MKSRRLAKWLATTLGFGVVLAILSVPAAWAMWTASGCAVGCERREVLATNLGPAPIRFEFDDSTRPAGTSEAYQTQRETVRLAPGATATLRLFERESEERDFQVLVYSASGVWLRTRRFESAEILPAPTPGQIVQPVRVVVARDGHVEVAKP